ncbi:MAG: sugar phosphorylase [Chloroflexota bacterium]
MVEASRFSLPPPAREKALDHLAFLYGAERAPELLARLQQLLGRQLQSPIPRPASARPVSEQDVFIITYPDQVQSPGQAPLEVLSNWLEHGLAGLFSGVHLLPFYPSSSDGGFSVIDYRMVDPAFGSWDQVERLAGRYRLMVDAVLNHVSASSSWFRAFLAGDPCYQDFFICLDPATDLTAVVRPRSTPLLTRFETAPGPRFVWTTFSADQIDLNYANPDVLLTMIAVLLHYVRRGAQVLRLDAVAFLWKQLGTPCLHLPQTHRLVQLIRLVLSTVAPWVWILTETNVPHQENVSYFGDGSNEAHLVYLFALPPLTLHAFLSGNASRLTAWLSDARPPSDQAFFFNFLASHDGIGLRPVDGILTPEEIDVLVKAVQARGGRVSHRATIGTGLEPYELNLTYFDALNDPQELEQGLNRAVARFLAAQAILLCLAGIPAVYFHSLFGSRSDFAGFERSGRVRSLNRQKLSLTDLERMLKDPHSLASRVFEGYAQLLRLRRGHRALHPAGAQQVLDLGPDVVAVVRTSPEGDERLLCLQRVTGDPPLHELRLSLPPSQEATDLISGDRLRLGRVPLGPYQVRWLRLDQP